MRTDRRFCTATGLVAGALMTMIMGCEGKEAPAPAPAAPADASAPAEPAAQVDKLPDPPAGLEAFPTPSPDGNPTTTAKVALGEMLFFDTRLSDSGTFACVTCHVPEKGWTDGEALSVKADGATNTRHSPTMYNVGYALQWYWDGRMPTLEEQILAAWKGQVGGTPDQVAAALAGVSAYKEHFQKAFGEDPSAENIPMALASFLRVTLRAGNAPWDRYQAGDKSAVSEDAVKGFTVFTKAGCAACHAPPLYTDMGYHNVGVGYDAKKSKKAKKGK
jgi:cytochrome c peroxidase